MLAFWDKETVEDVDITFDKVTLTLIVDKIPSWQSVEHIIRKILGVKFDSEFFNCEIQRIDNKDCNTTKGDHKITFSVDSRRIRVFLTVL